MAIHHYVGLPTILFAGLFATASPADVDTQRMQRDLRIMEGVLGDLQSAAPDAIDFHTRGLHLDGYGVLFLAEGPLSDDNEHAFSRAWTDDQGRNKIVHKIAIAKSAAKAAAQPGTFPSAEQTGKREKSLKKVRDMLGEFLGNYAGSIGQLNKNDRITVLYKPQNNLFPFPIAHGAITAMDDIDIDIETIAAAINTAGVEDAIGTSIDSMIHRQLAEADIEGQIDSLLQHVRRESKDKDVRVIVKGMAGHPARAQGENEDVQVVVKGMLGHDPYAQNALPLIEATAKKSDIDAFRRGRIDSAKFRQRITFSEREPSATKKIDIMSGILDQVLEPDDIGPFGRIQPTLGMYQPGLGALFFTNSSMVFTHIGAAEQGEAHLDRLKARLLEAVGDYGSTLRQVKSDEHVIVEFRSVAAPFAHDKPRRQLLKVGKSAIEAYSRGDMDLEAFRKKAVWRKL